MERAVEYSLGFGSASRNTINVAPILFSTKNDASAMHPGNLGYADSNAWSAGDDSTDAASQKQPVSSFTVLDTLEQVLRCCRGGLWWVQRTLRLAVSQCATSSVSLGSFPSALAFVTDHIPFRRSKLPIVLH
jgi:hypothetical protein